MKIAYHHLQSYTRDSSSSWQTKHKLDLKCCIKKQTNKKYSLHFGVIKISGDLTLKKNEKHILDYHSVIVLFCSFHSKNAVLFREWQLVGQIYASDIYTP